MPSYVRPPLSLVSGRAHAKVGSTATSLRDLSDADLAVGLAEGKDWAVTEAWYRFAPMVITTAERALGSTSEAEDLAQEVFFRLFRTAKTLRDSTALRSFVYSIALRTLKSQFRYRRVRAWLSFHEPETLVELRHAAVDVEARELLRKFYALLDRLSTRDRLVFILRRVEMMTIDEIALAMELSTSTVKRSMSNASLRLASWLEGDPSFAEFAGPAFPTRAQ